MNLSFSQFRTPITASAVIASFFLNLLVSAQCQAAGSIPSQVEQNWWRPTADKPLALHWMINGPLDINNPLHMGTRDLQGNWLPEPDVYDIDGQMNTAATVRYLHDRGKKVICYIDVGVYETYRPDSYKFQAIKPQIWGNPDAGWDNSYWLDVRRVDELKPIMQARMLDCKNKGFDAIEPDEIDGWENDTGFAISYQDQLRYNKAIAQWAHELGLSIGQKGDLIQTRDLVQDFDWTLNEECFRYKECLNPYDPILDKEFPGLQLYIQANKAVWVAEYASFTKQRWATICATSNGNRFNTSKFKLNLNGGRLPCTSSPAW